MDEKLVEQLRGVDHMSVEDCFLQSPLFAQAATAAPVPEPDDTTLGMEALIFSLQGDGVTNTVIERAFIAAKAAYSARPPFPEPEAEGEAVAHPDDLAVDRFAAAMKEKLAKKRAEGRGGWDDKSDCPNAFLTYLLREHVEKGDPVDVGNLAMMIHQRGERIG